MPLELAFWPDEIIALNQELASGLHPQLERELAKLPDADFVSRFAEIGSYCEIALDGTYSSDQICELSKIMLLRLHELRERPDEGIAQKILPV